MSLFDSSIKDVHTRSSLCCVVGEPSGNNGELPWFCDVDLNVWEVHVKYMFFKCFHCACSVGDNCVGHSNYMYRHPIERFYHTVSDNYLHFAFSLNLLKCWHYHLELLLPNHNLVMTNQPLEVGYSQNLAPLPWKFSPFNRKEKANIVGNLTLLGVNTVRFPT